MLLEYVMITNDVLLKVSLIFSQGIRYKQICVMPPPLTLYSCNLQKQQISHTIILYIFYNDNDSGN